MSSASPAALPGLLGWGWAGCVAAAPPSLCSAGGAVPSAEMLILGAEGSDWGQHSPLPSAVALEGSAEAAVCSGWVGEEGGAALGEQLARQRVPAGNPLGAPVCISVLPWWVQQTHWLFTVIQSLSKLLVACRSSEPGESAVSVSFLT